ncbi:hypothetical protein JCGZ_13495 [Jatropha curcas]|uniref:Leucine-rich repeat-containing N-terminal plant-type domain-containing protein n=1 Tax=Jatropha curcas TaxID=180498 RepID=A0A067LNJ4_JATCU|nr:hypothetical protein JCGZ_13495 [Jatropha curcas]
MMNSSYWKNQIIFLVLLNFHCQLALSSPISSYSAQSCLKDESTALLQLKQEFYYDASASIDCEPPRPKMGSWFLNLMLNNDVYRHLPKSNWTSPLESLTLNSTSFSRELPDSIGNLSSLLVLELSGCHFTRSIPASIGSLQQLVKLDLSNNNWTGKISDVFEKLKDINHLSVSNSNFTGILPSSIFNLTKLYCGIIPSCVYGLPSLVWFSLSFNQLTGQLGEFRSKSLLEIVLESNKIYGPIHPSVFELTNLTNLHLPSNNLSGVVNLNMFSKLKNLWGLDLSNNHFSVITSSINNSSNSSMLPRFYRLALSSCNIREISPSLCNITTFQIIDLSNNSLRGMIPQCLGNFSSELFVLNFGMNNFKGSIPGTFAEGNKLRNLNLNGN